MPFRLEEGPGAVPEDPEALFRDLRKRTIPGLLSQQADVLRSYVGICENHADIAIQLPTGSGKTLVGLLLAEWRRRKFGERVVYLCPTNQLVHQVASHAEEKYGLSVRAFVGSKADYNPAAESDWQQGDAIAITNYSSLFNSNPFFDDPQLIVLDDAHSAENYIANCWSLSIERHRREHEAAFAAVQSVLQARLSHADKAALEDDAHDSSARWVDKLSTPDLEAIIPELIAVLDQHTKDSSLKFPWSLIRPSLAACHLYLSTDAFLIRPLIPPTNTHKPFSGAKQRVYMSATLGAGGDLERTTGRSPILRLPVPLGWDKQGIGRRFFLFPQRSLDEEATEEFTSSAITVARRAFYLASDERTATKARDWVRKTLGFDVFDARQIEESKDPFVQCGKAVAVVANRYDGIDLIDDECRLLIVKGLPKGANLQERFLVKRMGAMLLLDDRILTRVVQGCGRCTRSPNDYAAVIVLGDDLQKYLLAAERRRFFHPEIQAEMQFGLEQSRNMTSKEMLQNLRHFLKQDNEWTAADAAILRLRSKLTQTALPATQELSRVVGSELLYQYAMWHGGYLEALEHCRSILGNLSLDSLRGYRALWLYLAGSAAYLAFKQNALSTDQIARDYYRQSFKAAPGLRWLIRLVQGENATTEVPERDIDPVFALVERLEGVFASLGMTHDRKYAAEESEILKGILQTADGRAFEVSHERLGRLLGYEAGRSNEDAAPDPWWIADSSMCFVFEDYSEAQVDSPLSARKARQVSGHPKWIREHVPLAKDATIVPVLLTGTRVMGPGSKPHLREVRYWNLGSFHKWAKAALGVIRELRSSFPGEADLMWRAEAGKRLNEANIGPRALESFLRESAAEVMAEGEGN